ncbi:hypothetical protein ASC97_29850 [Rhizobium sp. Root1203]|nr:hypothetical protein ASC97_29850 [Rhizobium sp. Root1203]
MAELEAKRRDFCPVRINLNEGDVLTDLDFFRKVLSAIIMAAFAAGAFGGRKGAAFFHYLELTASGEVKDVEQIPFVSAILIAQALRAGNKLLNVPDEIVTDDLITISAEVKKPIILLIDECNVLKNNRIILEKLRNIFMNLPGYMLMFAATEDFFPIMDDVFSPIMRQFKRIDIGPFKGDDDVRQCVQRPLERFALTPRDIRTLASSSFIKEVEALSARKPYEIQLICHELFRRCQEGKAKRFSLNLTTIEGIQAELARGQNVNDRSVIKSARKLRANFLQALEALCGGTEELSVSDSWRLEYLLHGETRWKQEQFVQISEELETLGLIVIDGHSTRFCGDQFDRVYLKYIARSKNTRVTLAELPVENYIFTLFALVAPDIEAMIPIGGITTESGAQDIAPTIDLLAGKPVPTDYETTPLLENMLTSILYQGPGKAVRLIELQFKSDMAQGQAWYIWREPEHLAGLKKIRRRFDDLTARGLEVGFEINIQSWDIVVPTAKAAADTIQLLGDEHLSTRVANEFMDMVTHYYVTHKDGTRAKEFAEAAFSLQQSRLHQNANNVGYLYIGDGNYKEARLWLQAALQYADEDAIQLHWYNSGVLHALVGDIPAARFDFLRAKDSKGTSAACLYQLTINEQGELDKFEVLDPLDVTPFVDKAISVLNGFGAIGAGGQMANLH